MRYNHLLIKLLLISSLSSIGCSDSEEANDECFPETNSELCERFGAECGPLETYDRCGELRTVGRCGTCDEGSCSAENQCVSCPNESDAEFCTRLNASCGEVTQEDLCGQSRTVSCGTCSDSEACGLNNTCVCEGESEPELCSQAAAVCGGLVTTDRCGEPRTIGSCGICADPESCNNNQCPCTPESDEDFCSRVGANCGAISGTDNCGAPRTVDRCGTCDPDQTCQDNNVCTCDPEDNTTFCARLGAQCGPLTGLDNCGRPRTISSCGSCTPPQQCGNGGGGNVCGCSAESEAEICARLGAECGAIVATDNCGQTRDITSCGGCQAPDSCGGAEQANRCGCSESDGAFCAQESAECGSVTGTDRCGVVRTVENCGLCTDPLSCNGGGEANQCGCTAESDEAFCQRIGAQCGTVTALDNCGASRTRDCGTCTEPDEECGAGGQPNICECAYEGDEAFCDRQNAQCGTVVALDNCGQERPVDCGGCEDGLACTTNSDGNNVCLCVPDDDATLCARANSECGPTRILDNCGEARAIECGNCPEGQDCRIVDEEARGVCECIPVPESDEAFCDRLGATCGSVTGTDSCGQERVVEDCGDCSPNQVCTNGEGDQSSQCTCAPEADEIICRRFQVECGPSILSNQCDEDQAVNCGNCPEGEVCTDNGECECEPEDEETLCLRAEAECGSVTIESELCPNLGRISADCGECEPGLNCFRNRCVIDSFTELRSLNTRTCAFSAEDPQTSSCWDFADDIDVTTDAPIEFSCDDPIDGPSPCQPPSAPQAPAWRRTLPLTADRPLLQVVSGITHTCVLLADGQVQCGSRSRSEPLSTDPIQSGVTVLDLGEPAEKLTAGNHHTCALLVSHTIHCWTHGADGRPDVTASASLGENMLQATGGAPISFSDSQGQIIDISAGSVHTCALLTNGRIRCWGQGQFGKFSIR